MVSKKLSAASTVTHRYAEQGSTPATPASGFSASYMRNDGLYVIDDAGLVTGPLAAAVALVLLDPATSTRNTIQSTTSNLIEPLRIKKFAAAGGTESLIGFYDESDTLTSTIKSTGEYDLRNITLDYTRTQNTIDPTMATTYTWNPASSPGGGTHVVNSAYIDYGTTNTSTGTLIGHETGLDVTSSGVVGLRGYNSYLGNDGAGTIPSAALYYGLSPWNDGGGAITNLYGVYMEDVTVGVNNYSLYTNAGDVVLNAANGAGNVTVGGTPVSVNYDLGLVGDGVLMQKETTTPTADTGYGKTYWKADNMFYGQDGAGEEHVIHGFPTFKSYTVSTQGLGTAPDAYAGGYYEYSAADVSLTQGNLTQSFGTASVSYAAHAFMVAGAAGVVDTGVVGLRINGTSINDAGTLGALDTETIIADITAVATDEYAESSKKWLGTIEYELFTVSGSPVNFSIDINYGFAKYDDFGNNDFNVTDVEAVGFGGNNDSNFDIVLIHHRTTGWTYSAGAFTPITAANTIASLVGDHTTYDQVANNGNYAWKRSGLSSAISGSASEGVILLVNPSAINTVEYVNLHIGVEF